jgi:hypothetical protein
VALASTGANDEGLVHLRRAAELDPANPAVQNDLQVLLQQQRR